MAARVIASATVSELAALCGPLVVVRQSLGPHVEVDVLPAERQRIARAVAGRRAEFATGRACARAALAALGGPRVAIPSGAHGEPLWPAGFVGSITHTDRFAAAAVAPTTAVRAVGVDAEPCAPLPPGVARHVATDEELDAALAAVGAPVADRVLFSAKEATFKAVYPLDRRVVGFSAIEVRLASDHRFEAVLAHRGGERWSGRWVVGERILTAVVVESRPAGEVRRPAAGGDPR